MASNTPRIDRLQKNYLINGDMRIAQRNTSFAAVADSTYTLDRYQYVKTGAMVHTVSQDTDVPTLAQAGYLFQNSLRLNLTTPDTAIAAGDYCMLMQKVEGYNYANLAQKDFTLSFWVKATLAGTYSISFGNSAGDQAVPYQYTINATNTWERKTLHITASPAAGTWNYTNGIGLYVRWTLAAGTNFQFTNGIWGAGNRWATPSQVNGVNTGATDFRITGAILCEGHVDDPEFSTFGKDFATEFNACIRYYRKITNSSGLGQNTTSIHQVTTFQPEMRAAPTPGIFGGNAQITDQISTDFTQSSPNITSIAVSSTGGRFALANFSGLTAQRFYTIESDSNTGLTFDAEL